MSIKLGDLVGEVYFNVNNKEKNGIHLGYISRVNVTASKTTYCICWDDDWSDGMEWDKEDIIFFKECLNRYTKDPISCIYWMVNEKGVAGVR